MNVQLVTAAAAPLPAQAPAAAAVPASYQPETGPLTTTQAENLDLAALVGLLPTSTTLLQTQYPAPVSDDTILDAGMDNSLALALEAKGLPSKLPGASALTTTQAGNLDLAAMEGLWPASTTLLQAGFPSSGSDTTLLQAAIDDGLALATDASGTVPASVLGPPDYLDRLGLPNDNAPPDFKADLAALAAAGQVFQGRIAALGQAGQIFQAELQALAPNAAAPAALTTTETATQLTLAALPRVGPTLAALLEAGSSGAVAASSVLQAATELQASAAVAQQATTQVQAATTDLEAEDLVAQATMVLQAQQALQASTQSGSGDIAALLSGLPAGATATLMGGGWAIVPPGADRMGAQWSFQFPFAGIDIPAVTSSTRTDPTGSEHHQPSGAAGHLTTYGQNGREQDASGVFTAPTLDLLD